MSRLENSFAANSFAENSFAANFNSTSANASETYFGTFLPGSDNREYSVDNLEQGKLGDGDR